MRTGTDTREMAGDATFSELSSSSGLHQFIFIFSPGKFLEIFSVALPLCFSDDAALGYESDCRSDHHTPKEASSLHV
jgi:hypothetical protein